MAVREACFCMAEVRFFVAKAHGVRAFPPSPNSWMQISLLASFLRPLPPPPPLLIYKANVFIWIFQNLRLFLVQLYTHCDICRQVIIHRVIIYWLDFRRQVIIELLFIDWILLKVKILNKYSFSNCNIFLFIF